MRTEPYQHSIKPAVLETAPPPASVADLEKRIALLMAAREELERRKRERQPVDVTPAKGPAVQ